MNNSLGKRLGVSVMAVGVVREVLDGRTPAAIRALEKCDGDVFGAAKWLALFKKLFVVSEQITQEVVDGVCSNRRG